MSVPILGDTAIEPDEYFWVRIVGAPGGGNWVAYRSYGAGVTVNDDGLEPQPEVFFEDGFEDLD